jgi:asparagine synthase (glutamine-hydrolysing)
MLLAVKLPFFTRKSPFVPQIQVNPNWLLALDCPKLTSDGITWRDDRLVIFHTQPVFSPNQRFAIVGDIWLSNIRELSHQHQGVNPLLQPLSIIANLWEKFGVDCLTQLQGIFALTVWDREQQQLYLGRDRVGGKTLYYAKKGKTHWIAPRLKTLAPYHSHEVDIVAMRDYLSCAFVPGDRTLWQDVRELRPGMYVCLPEDSQPQPYWQPKEDIQNADKSIKWHGEKLRSLLNQIVQESLPNNEPVGAYLSGGLDSSCITALASKFHNYPVHTYSLHFGADCPHELEFSSVVAEHCQTQHHILEITPQQMWELLPTTMAHLDDPIGDPLTVPNYLLGKLAAQDVTVILNGEGGDPCFGGPKNKPMLLNSLYGSPRNHANELTTYLTSFKKCFAYLPQLFRPDIWQTVQNEPSVFAPDLNSDADYLNRLMLLNIKFKGADHILTKVNNLTSAAGVEGRSPLFDQRIVEMSLQIPPAYKLSGADEKAVLKQAVADILPEAIITRPKSGMMVPVQRWFRQLWQREAQGLLLNRKAAIAPYLNQALIRDWLNYRGDTWSRYGVKLWLLVSLELWLQVNKN